MYAHDDVAAAEWWQQQPSGTTVLAAAESFRMLADPTRLAMLWRLCGAEYDVTTLARPVGVARPAVSQHLAKLRMTGLVATRREGRRVIYQPVAGTSAACSPRRWAPRSIASPARRSTTDRQAGDRELAKLAYLAHI